MNAGKMKEKRVQRFKDLIDVMEGYKRLNQYQ